MAKDLIEDIKRPKRSLQDVLPASPNRGESKTKASADGTDERLPRPVSAHPRRPARRSRSRWLVILLIILAIIITVYFASAFFGRAIVMITSRRAPLTVSGTYRAIKLPSGTASSTSLGFQVMTIRGSEAVTIPASQTVLVSERASGTIVVVNRYSQNAQRLISNTRFEASNGKIYRIRESALVPGYKLIDGALTPGELAVKVTADQPGADYNGQLSTFTIPGFKNDARFNTITARAKTPFAGGFVGEQKVLSLFARLAAETELTSQLKKRLLAEAVGQTPDEYVWYPESVFWRLGESSATADPSSGQAVKLTRQIELVVPIFSRTELSQELARRFVPTYNGAPVLVDNIDHLNLQLVSVLADPEHLTEFVFTLEGESALVWQFDPSALTHDLAGRGVRDYQTVFVKYPSIIASQVTFSPPWLIYFPTDPKRISLTIETPSDKIPGATN